MTKNFSILEALSFGWLTTKKNFWFFARIILVFLTLFLLSQISSWLSSKYELPPLVDSFLFLGDIFLFLAVTVFNIGVFKISLDFVFGREADFAELFRNYKFFFPYFFAQILYGLILFVGFLLLVIPAFIWGIKYGFFGYFVIDRKMGPISALKASAKLTQGIKLKLFLLILIFSLIMLAGALIFGIGLLVALPVVWLGFAFVYKKLLEQTEGFNNSSNASLSSSGESPDLRA